MDILLGKRSVDNSQKGILKNAPFYGKDSLKNYNLIESDKLIDKELIKISRALYFPPYPSPILRTGGESRPLTPRPVPDCDCESCNELRVYFS